MTTTIKVTFSNGKSICFHNSIDTLISVLRGIDSSHLALIPLKSSGRLLVTQNVEEADRKFAVELGNGWWYIHKFQNTELKFRQLYQINRILNLGLKIEIVDVSEASDYKFTESKKRPKKSIKIKFENDVIEGESCSETLVNFVNKIGIEEIARKDLYWRKNKVIETYKDECKREKLNDFRWLLIPANIKETSGLIKTISLMLRCKCEVLVA